MRHRSRFSECIHYVNMFKPFHLACVASVIVQRAYPHSGGAYSGPALIFSVRKYSTQQGVVGERESLAQTPWLAPDWCGVVILVDKCANFHSVIPVMTRVWLVRSTVEEGFFFEIVPAKIYNVDSRYSILCKTLSFREGTHLVAVLPAGFRESFFNLSAATLIFDRARRPRR